MSFVKSLMNFSDRGVYYFKQIYWMAGRVTENQFYELFSANRIFSFFLPSDTFRSYHDSFVYLKSF